MVLAEADVRIEISDLKGRVTSVEAYITDDKKRWETNSTTHRDLYGRTERPSWLVAWVLTIMGTLVGGLSIWAVTH